MVHKESRKREGILRVIGHDEVPQTEVKRQYLKLGGTESGFKEFIGDLLDEKKIGAIGRKGEICYFIRPTAILRPRPKQDDIAT